MVKQRLRRFRRPKRPRWKNKIRNSSGRIAPASDRGDENKKQSVTQLVVSQLIKQVRDHRAKVITGQQGQHHRLDDKPRREIGARGFPAECK